MTRELVVLGTASQVPTRTRNHNGYLLRWDDLGLLFDPGEGTQRQLLLAGERSSAVTHVLLTHHHGDHCMGLPGVLQRMVLDQRTEPVHLVHPEPSAPFIDRLLGLGLFDGGIDITRVALPMRASTLELPDGRTLHAAPLDHRVPTLGYRLQEPARRRFRKAALAAHGLEGPEVGELAREGSLTRDGRLIRSEDVTDLVEGQSVAFVMDTRVCDGARHLLTDVDLGVVEATFQDGDEDLAARYGHLTSGQAGRLAAESGVRRLVVTHYSQRYAEEQTFADQAGTHHDDVVAAVDLQRVQVPPRLSQPVGRDEARAS